MRVLTKMALSAVAWVVAGYSKKFCQRAYLLMILSFHLTVPAVGSSLIGIRWGPDLQLPATQLRTFPFDSMLACLLALFCNL